MILLSSVFIFSLSRPNSIIWPLFHYFMEYTAFEQTEWEAYVRANQKFADTVIENQNDGDTVWVHYYKLMLIPQLIRAIKHELTIGFF